MAEIRCPPHPTGTTDGPSVPLYKVLIIGDSNVGKTSLLNRYCEDSFQGSLIATVGIDYKTKRVSLDDETVKLQIWDTAGQERFRTLTNAYFRGALGAVLLYDITSRDSFTNVAGWMESVEEHASATIRIIIVGHKVDLQDDRNVSAEEGKKLAENYDAQFVEASAKVGINCGKIFTLLAADIKAEKESASYVHQSSCGPGGITSSSTGKRLDQSSTFSKQTSCC